MFFIPSTLREGDPTGTVLRKLKPKLKKDGIDQKNDQTLRVKP